MASRTISPSSRGRLRSRRKGSTSAAARTGARRGRRRRSAGSSLPPCFSRPVVRALCASADVAQQPLRVAAQRRAQRVEVLAQLRALVVDLPRREARVAHDAARLGLGALAARVGVALRALEDAASLLLRRREHLERPRLRLGLRLRGGGATLLLDRRRLPARRLHDLARLGLGGRHAVRRGPVGLGDPLGRARLGVGAHLGRGLLGGRDDGGDLRAALEPSLTRPS